MRVCDRCRSDSFVQTFCLGRPDQSYNDTMHFELCNDCRDKLFETVQNFLKNSEEQR